MKRCIIELSIVVITMASCVDRIPSDVLSAIDSSGKNKEELLKVINYYNQNPDDSLKLEAAYYLISNMQDLVTLDSLSVASNSVYFERLESERLKRGHKLSADSIYYYVDQVNKERHNTNPVSPSKKWHPDLEILTASSIIQNIEQAFYVWTHYPWCRHVSFTDFCEYILPYRCSENYSMGAKKFFMNRYKCIADSLSTEENPFNVAKIIISDIDSWFTEDPSFFAKYTYLNAAYFSDYLKGAVGSCVNTTEVKITALRSMGIPTAYDCLLNWANSNSHHFWYKIIDKQNDTITQKLSNIQRPIDTQNIMTGSSYTIFPRQKGLPKDVILYFNRTVSKVFRKSYINNKMEFDMLKKVDDIPPEFLNSHFKDVTDKYVNCMDLDYPLIKDIKLSGSCCLLCFDNTGWTVQCIGELSHNGKYVTFRNIGKNIVYLPALYHAGKYSYIDTPFLLDNNGNVNKLYPRKQMERMILHTKYPLRGDIELWMSFMKGGKFKVSNRKDLSDTLTIYRIDSLPFYQKTVDVNLHGRKYKYLIYDYSGVDSILIKRYDTGEIAYISPSGEKVKIRRIFGNPGTYSHESKMAFDGDCSTYFEEDALIKNKYIGVELKNLETINKIQYCSRNDDNGINEGDIYELYAWQTGWKFIGREIGKRDSTIIFNNVPVNALFLLKNVKGGTENRIFTYDDGKQNFW